MKRRKPGPARLREIRAIESRLRIADLSADDFMRRAQATDSPQVRASCWESVRQYEDRVRALQAQLRQILEGAA